MINQTINGYKIIRKLGAGGMGTVYYAENEMRHKAAIKVVHKELCDKDDLAARFWQEHKTMLKLQGHPNIIALQATTASTDMPVIVMEYLEGEDLYNYIKRTKKPIEESILLEWSRQILSALQYAHEKGVIHRDIKPSNIFLTQYSMIKVLDFGIAKVTQETAEGNVDETLLDTLTKTRASLGAPQFMSPEQSFDPKIVTHLSDIYSFGKTLNYLATGGGNPTIILTEKIKKIVQKCTEQNLKDRYSSCQNILDDLSKNKAQGENKQKNRKQNTPSSKINQPVKAPQKETSKSAPASSNRWIWPVCGGAFGSVTAIGADGAVGVLGGVILCAFIAWVLSFVIEDFKK